MDDIVAKPAADAARLAMLEAETAGIASACLDLARRASAVRKEMKTLRTRIVASGRLQSMDDLREEIMRLERALRPPGKHFPFEWKLTKTQDRMLGAICAGNGEPVSMERLMTVSFRQRVDVEHEHPRIHVNHIRKKLKPFGYGIETSWGWGYMPDAALLKVWAAL